MRSGTTSVTAYLSFYCLENVFADCTPPLRQLPHILFSMYFTLPNEPRQSLDTSGHPLGVLSALSSGFSDALTGIRQGVFRRRSVLIISERPNDKMRGDGEECLLVWIF